MDTYDQQQKVHIAPSPADFGQNKCGDSAVKILYSQQLMKNIQ